MNIENCDCDTFKVSFIAHSRTGTMPFSYTLNAKDRDEAFRKSLIEAKKVYEGEGMTFPLSMNDDNVEICVVSEDNEIDSDERSLSSETISNEIDLADVPYTIFEYIRQINKGKIILRPDFQRKLVWKKSQKSRFIESILLNYPTPPIYLNETKDSKWIVIDGLQRSTTLQSFFQNELVLEGLEALPEYNGKKYDTLSPSMQTRIEDKKLTIFLLKPSTSLSVVYDLFYRINTGGTQLNKQEIRNCIYTGKSTELLKVLSEESCFKKAIDCGVSPNRMKDREMILRYISFRWFDYGNIYTGDLSNYLESSMKKINTYSDEEIYEIKTDFTNVMNMASMLWGRACFRIPTVCTRGSINTSVFESVSLALSKIGEEKILRNKEILINNYRRLLRNDAYLDSVISATSSKNKVRNRFEHANKILGENLK